MAGYIGRGISIGNNTIDRFAGDGTLVSFALTFPASATTSITVVVDDVIQEPDISYSVSGYNVVFTTAPPIPASGITNNIYVIHNGLSITLPVPADGTVTQAKLSENVKNFYPESFTGDGVATDFTITYPIQSSTSILVREDGIIKVSGTDYNVLADETTLRFVVAPANGVTIDLTYIGMRGTEDIVAGSLTVYPYTAAADQTIFSGIDDNSLVLAYNVSYEQVFKNGTKLNNTEYTATDGTSITLTVAAIANDIIEIVSMGTWLPVDSYTKAESDNKLTNISARNKVQNVDPLSQGTSTRGGMSSTIYTGDAIAKSIATGVDMATGDFGGLVWIKERTDADTLNLSGHILTDSVRGVNNYLASETTGAEIVDAQTVTAFEATGFAVGTSNLVNEAENYIAWSWQTTKKATGTTNGGKPYTAHYNPDMNFSIVGYEGDGVDGHEIPHHLGTAPELSIVKSRNGSGNEGWIVQSPLLGLDVTLVLNTTDALVATSTSMRVFTDTTITLGVSAWVNTALEQFIQYNFASKSGVCKIGKYVGTGAAGNYVSTEVDGGDAFKPSFVIVRSLDIAQDWHMYDGIRAVDVFLKANASDAEITNTTLINFVNSGIVLESGDSANNYLSSEYIFMAFAETSIDATKALADYPYATTPDTISITDQTLISVANGFSANGQVDTQYQFGAGITKAFGVGFESKKLYMYTDKTGVLGTTEVRPLSGITRNDADKYGVVSPSDPTLRTTSKHYDYESDSGVASSEGTIFSDRYPWRAVNKDSNDIVAGSNWLVESITTSAWIYTFNEKRIIKSVRIRSLDISTRDPRRFTIRCQNIGDGTTWVDVFTGYTSVDYVGNGDYLWGDLLDLSTITTAYDKIKIDITANNGDATYTGMGEIELNTIIASDYYLIEEGKMYGADNVAIERMYLGEFSTDSVGDIINTTIVNYSVAEQEVNVLNIHKDLTVYGEANGRQFATAWVSFDGTENPPLIRGSFNVADVVDLGVGIYKIIFETPMDNQGYVFTQASKQDVADLGSFGYPRLGGITRNSLSLGFNNELNALRDQEEVLITVFGGKKIGLVK